MPHQIYDARWEVPDSRSVTISSSAASASESAATRYSGWSAL